MVRRPILPERQCHAMADQRVRSVSWSPPHRCLQYAGPNGYCRFHQLVEDQAPAEDPQRTAGEDDHTGD